MSLKLFNTFSRTKEEFIPIEKGKVKFYMCGPTVYDYIHIGNARAFIVFDVLRRFFEYLNYDVSYVMNLTDIDDNIINRAQKDGVEFKEITTKYTQAFFEDIDDLGIKRADVHPRATEHVDDIIALIQALVDKGIAYEVDGDVFFDVTKFEHYGRLSGKKLDELKAGARSTIGEKKRNPLDFALWKSQKRGEPAWKSPWGPGRPGWHIECSTMSMKYLGKSFDIHAGGTDLVFPHHENEIAQSESVTNQQFVKYWLHNGFLNIEGNKMSKSLGNFRTVREVLKSYPGVVIRMFFLQKHYRSPIDLTPAGFQAAARASSRLKIFYDKLVERLKDEAIVHNQGSNRSSLPYADEKLLKSFESMKKELVDAMRDDLNTAVAISKLFEIVREANKLLSKDEVSKNEKFILSSVKRDIEGVDSFLGVIDTDSVEKESDLVGELMKLIIDVRNELRSKKDWSLADKIRDELDKKGIALEDKSSATEWRLK